MTVPRNAPGLSPADGNRPLTKFEEQLLQKVDELNSKVEAWPTLLQVHNDIGDTRDKLQQLNDLEKRAFA